MSKHFDKYLLLKSKVQEAGIEDCHALKQYLHICQVFNMEQESFDTHKRKVENWLNNIEKSIREEIKAAE